MVCKLRLSEVLPLRAAVLRNGHIAPEACINPGDEAPDTFHTGWKDAAGSVWGIATFMAENHPWQTGIGYRLRGMAVAPDWQGKGLGKAILQAGIEILQQQQINYLWCNARKVAYPFYENCGFIYLSAEFEIAGIGPHKVMLRKL